MIKRVSVEDSNGLNLVPVAAIAVSTTRFTDMGIGFDRSNDDLDDYDIAVFTIPGAGAFALMHYLHSPVSDITLMVEDSAVDQATFVPIMRSVAKAFHIPAELFHWQMNGQEAHLTEAADTAALHREGA